MPRNRIIKADFWSDEKIGKLSLLARLLFIGTWNHADDSGICRANIHYLKNQIFPYDIDIKIQQIQDALTELSLSTQVRLITHKDESYLIIKHFSRHQTINRPSKFRYINDMNNITDNTHGTLSEYSRTKGKGKGKGKGKEKGNTQNEYSGKTPAETENKQPSSFETKNIINQKYPEYAKIIKITESEHHQLTDKFGTDQTKKWIESLYYHIGSTGKKYKSHYLTILNWSRREKQKPNSADKKKGFL